MHGYCLGGGGCLALACDLRVAATDRRFGMPEVLRGMNMSWRTVPLMVATFGPARTELLLTQRYLGAEEGQVWGLVNRVVPGGGEAARQEALRWANEIAESVPPLAATMIKETVNATANALTPLVHMGASGSAPASRPACTDIGATCALPAARAGPRTDTGAKRPREG